MKKLIYGIVILFVAPIVFAKSVTLHNFNTQWNTTQLRNGVISIKGVQDNNGNLFNRKIALSFLKTLLLVERNLAFRA